MTPQRYRRIVSVLDRRQPDLTVILEGVHKPHNLSAIQRSCDAVGVFEAHAVAPDKPYRPHETTASGSAKWVKVHNHTRISDLLPKLKRQGMQIFVAHLSKRALDYREMDYTQPVALLMGTEKYGVSNVALDDADGEVMIPMYGMVASLNVSVAAAVILYEVQRQRQAAGLYERPRLAPDIYRETLFQWGYPRLAKRYAALGIPFPRVGKQGEILDPVPHEIRRRL